MVPFYESIYSRYRKYTQNGVADFGYGSKENYRFMEERGIEAFVKYIRFTSGNTCIIRLHHSAKRHPITTRKETIMCVRWDNMRQ